MAMAIDTSTVEATAQALYDSLMKINPLPTIVYFEFVPSDNENFVGNIGPKFGYRYEDGLLVSAAVDVLEAQSLIYVDREEDADRPEHGSHGDAYPKRFVCTARVR